MYLSTMKINSLVRPDGSFEFWFRRGVRRYRLIVQNSSAVLYGELCDERGFPDEQCVLSMCNVSGLAGIVKEFHAKCENLQAEGVA